MGYYIRLEGSDFTIPTENLDAAYEVMCKLNEGHAIKSGGSFGGGGYTEKWFSWMDANYPETCKDAKDIFEMLGFDVTVNEEGLHLDWYDNKTGQEDIFLAAVAPLVKSGSWLSWRGEEGDEWEYIFEDGKVDGISAYIPFNGAFYNEKGNGVNEADKAIAEMLKENCR